MTKINKKIPGVGVQEIGIHGGEVSSLDLFLPGGEEHRSGRSVYKFG